MTWMSRHQKLKKLRDQTIVITGASSGIGRATARVAAERGARVVLTSPNEDDLRNTCDEIRRKGGRASYVAADDADPGALDRVADVAVRDFGAIDTWVNNSDTPSRGKLTEIPLEEERRLFDRNFWGTVHGCRTAMRHLRRQGGAIINVSGVVTERAHPGVDSVSTRALEGYTDALRTELEQDEVPISVTQVKLSSENAEHVRHFQALDAELPSPAHAPETVASEILECAQSRVREITVGGAGRMMTVMGIVAPKTSTVLRGRTVLRHQRLEGRSAATGESPRHGGPANREHEPHEGHVERPGAYTSAMLSDVTRALPYIAAGVALAAGVRRWQRHNHAA
jgi:NAD(P)-dependent dehydrogenase (short-subunit alcohol dehydrogenase family)